MIPVTITVKLATPLTIKHLASFLGNLTDVVGCAQCDFKNCVLTYHLEEEEEED